MFNERQLNQCYSDHREKYRGLKEDYFAVLYLANRFSIPQKEAVRWVTFGGFDYGIDAYYLDDNSGNLFLYQFKWSNSVLQMAQSIDRIVDKGIDAIFGNEPIETNRNDIINRLRADVRERQSRIGRVFLYFISKGTLPSRGSNAALDGRLEDLERASTKIRHFFKGEVEILLRVNDDATPPPQFRFPLTWSGSSTHQLKSGETVSTGFISLLELARMYERMNLRFLQKNIRAGLIKDTSPNRALRKAFEDIARGNADPEAFVFRHNGVSVEASHFVEMNGAAEIVEPRVLNGAQTIVTLHRFLHPEGKGREPLNADEIARLSKVRVLAKVLFGCNEQFVTDVTIANNKQNPVKPWNLRASDRYQIDLEQRFKDGVHLLYDRLENAYASRGEADWEEEGILPGKVIEIERLGLALTAASGEIDKMSRMPEVWEQEATYRQIFRPRFVEEDYDLRRIVLAYKVQYFLHFLVREIASRGETKYGFITRGRNLVWGLTIQGLLNDPKLNELLEDFGENLTASFDFKERLTKIVVAKLVPILSSAISLPTYRDAIKAEKYSFLKSNAFFNICRNLGADKFDWTTKRL